MADPDPRSVTEEADGGALGQARLHIDEGRFSVAVTILRSLLEHRPRDRTVRLALARALVHQGRVEDAGDVIRPLRGDSNMSAAERAAALAVWGMAGTVAGDPAAAAATEASIAADDPPADGARLAWSTKAIQHYLRGDFHHAIEAASSAVSASDATSAMLRTEAAVTLAMMLMHADRFAEADAVLASGRDQHEPRAARSLRRRALGRVRFHAGRWDDAVVLLDPRRDVGAGIELSDDEWALSAGLLAVLYVHQDRLEEARHLLGDAAGPIASGQAVMLSWPAVLLAEAEGDLHRAAQLADRLIGAVERSRSVVRFRLFGPDLVRVCLAAGATGPARLVCDHLHEVAAAAGTPSVEASARLCSALLNGSLSEAVRATDLYAVSPRLLDRAVALEAVAALAGEHAAERGGEAELAALAIYEGLRATRSARRVRASLRRKGVAYLQRRPRRDRDASGWAALSPAEQAVARLVADGLTNAEIASRLYVSPRTVETHIAHVFGKLGVASRAGVAAVAARAR